MNVIVLVFCFLGYLSIAKARTGKNSLRIYKIIKKTPGSRSNLRHGNGKTLRHIRPFEDYPNRHSHLNPSISAVKYHQDDKHYNLFEDYLGHPQRNPAIAALKSAVNYPQDNKHYNLFEDYLGHSQRNPSIAAQKSAVNYPRDNKHYNLFEDYPNGHSRLNPSISAQKSAVNYPQDNKHYGLFKDYLGHSQRNPPIAALKSAVNYPQDDKHYNLFEDYLGHSQRNPSIAALKSAVNYPQDDKPHNLFEDYPNGHSRLNPSITALKSAVKYPQDPKHFVYGNLEHLGVTDNTSRVLYSGFRKGNNIILAAVLQAVENLKSKKKSSEERNIIYTLKEDKYNANTRAETLDQKTKRIQDLLNSQVPVHAKYPEADTSKEIALKVVEFLKNLPIDSQKISLDEKTKYIEDFLNNKMMVFTDGNSLNYGHKNNQIGTLHNLINEEENNANEVMDEYSSEDSESDDELPDFRRKSKKKKKKKRKFRHRDSKYTSKESVDSSESGSSDYERNPGNPFTIHKNKYKQNWLWNHFMDGDHMNINPFGPPFANMGPSGADLFFGRKWWYYNQDDYKPMG